MLCIGYDSGALTYVSTTIYRIYECCAMHICKACLAYTSIRILPVYAYIRVYAYTRTCVYAYTRIRI